MSVSHPQVVAVAPASPAERAGLRRGDEVLRLNGRVPRDVIEWRFLADEAELELDIRRGGLELSVEVHKRAGQPLGAEVHSAVFDRVQTCDNHCAFCFIYQLPPGMRRSLYLKDDDYRLSFLYGNFTTLTRFTEADLERVVTERLSPLHVSIHATDPDVRAAMLRNRRGATSLRWLRALLDHGIEVRGQVVVCPGVNDGAVLEDTFAGILDRFPELSHVAVVPLGVSRFNPEPAMRPHTRAEADAVVDLVDEWQGVYLDVLGRRLAFAADEYYLLAGRPFPATETYDDFPMHEDGVGMARAFEREFTAGRELGAGPVSATRSGFFAWVDGAPAEGYRAPRNPAAATGLRANHEASCAPAATTGVRPSHGQAASTATATGRRPSHGQAATSAATGLPASRDQTSSTATATGRRPRHDQAATSTVTGLRPSHDRASSTPVALLPRRRAPIGVLTGRYGAQVLAPLLAALDRPDVRLVPVENTFFGGNTGVTGLLVGADLARTLAEEPDGHRYLLPDVCLSEGRFLDGTAPADLPRPVDVVPTNGAALRTALEDA
jgi:putative radical SAM enzyme (TIGR03279 family)